jgi:arylsulfatase A-like enzyme/predicted negative regulator of RcsB-dependent stress response
MPRRRSSKESAVSEDETRRASRGFHALLGVLAVAGIIIATALLFSGEERGGTTRPHIILVTIDTLRADALGFAGNEKVETPFLDRLAREGIVFANAHAHNVITLPSHANILTGLLPYQHGIRDNAGYVLDPRHETIAARLKEEGYATGAFVAAFPLDSRYGLNRGFDRYDDDYPKGTNPTKFIMAERPASEVLSAAVEWWGSISGQNKFLWVHLFEPHAPYVPPPHLAARYADDPYLGEVAAVDQELERFLSPILAEGNVLLIVTSDHGESLGAHGELTHGLFAYEETLKVPLILHEPGHTAPRIETAPVRHIDIVPTILERLGLRVSDELQGRSLLRAGEEEETYFEALSAALNRGWAPLTGLIRDNHKYIHLPIPELYDLEKDPGEQRNILESERRIAHRLRERLESIEVELPSRREITAEEQAQLLSLGYTAGTSAGKTTYTAEDDPKNLVHLDQKLQEAIAHYQAGDLPAGVAKARAIIEERPDMQQARDVLAFLLQQSEKPDEAIDVILEAIALGTATREMRQRLALILSETGRSDEAVRLLETLEPGRDPELLNAYGIALADLGRLEDAVAQFRRVLERDPRNAVAWQNLGITALRGGEVERSREYLQRALEINDRLPLAWNTLGVVQMRKGDSGAAIAAWQRAVALDPKQYDALFNLSLTAGRAGQWELAREALVRFIDTAPPERYGSDLDTARQMLREVERRRTGA